MQTELLARPLLYGIKFKGYIDKTVFGMSLEHEDEILLENSCPGSLVKPPARDSWQAELVNPLPRK